MISITIGTARQYKVRDNVQLFSSNNSLHDVMRSHYDYTNPALLRALCETTKQSHRSHQNVTSITGFFRRLEHKTKW